MGLALGPALGQCRTSTSTSSILSKNFKDIQSHLKISYNFKVFQSTPRPDLELSKTQKNQSQPVRTSHEMNVIYCIISIDLASHTSQGLWSGPDFGQCHMSHWLQLHVRNGSKNSFKESTVLELFHRKNIKFWLRNLFVTGHIASGPSVKMPLLCHRSHPQPNWLKWYSNTI